MSIRFKRMVLWGGLGLGSLSAASSCQSDDERPPGNVAARGGSGGKADQAGQGGEAGRADARGGAAGEAGAGQGGASEGGEANDSGAPGTGGAEIPGCGGPRDAHVGDACSTDCDCESIEGLRGLCTRQAFETGSELPVPVCFAEGGRPAPALPAVRTCDDDAGVAIGGTSPLCYPACRIDEDGSHGCENGNACFYLGYDATPSLTAWGFCWGGCDSDGACPGREVCQLDLGTCRKTSEAYEPSKAIGERCEAGDDGVRCNCLAPARTEPELDSLGMCTSVCRTGDDTCPSGFSCDAQLPESDLVTGDELFDSVPAGTWGKCLRNCTYESDCFAVGGFCELHAGMAAQKTCELGVRPTGSCPVEAVDASSGLSLTGYPLRVPTESLEGVTAGPDGNVWFTLSSADSIGRITPCGLVTTFSGLSEGSWPHSIIAGPDGNLWFTEFEGNRIGRITPDGIVSEFPISTPDSQPGELTIGPDGNVWFTSFAGNVGRVTPATGEILEFGVLQALRGIVTGPDDRLWFVEGLANKIGAITTTGDLTEYAIPTADSLPFGITLGPDAALWFTETAGNQIGRVTTDGEFTEYPLPSEGAFPAQITVGPDDNLWFVEKNGSRVGRITTVGVITEYPLPTPARGPFAISAGPEGTLWFTEDETTRVVKFKPPSPG